MYKERSGGGGGGSSRSEILNGAADRKKLDKSSPSTSRAFASTAKPQLLDGSFYSLAPSFTSLCVCVVNLHCLNPILL